MKKIEALIRPDKLGSVKSKLAKGGYPALTTYEVKGRGRQSGIVQTVNGHTLYADLLPKAKIDLVVKDEEVDEAVRIIVEETRTGAIGDGKIFVSTIDEVIRIRTGDIGTEAV